MEYGRHGEGLFVVARVVESTEDHHDAPRHRVRCPFCEGVHSHGTDNGLRSPGCAASEGRAYLVQPARRA